MPNNVEDEIKVYLEQISVVEIQEDDIVDDDIILLSDIINGTQYKLLHCGVSINLH